MLAKQTLYCLSPLRPAPSGQPPSPRLSLQADCFSFFAFRLGNAIHSLHFLTTALEGTLLWLLYPIPAPAEPSRELPYGRRESTGHGESETAQNMLDGGSFWELPSVRWS